MKPGRCEESAEEELDGCEHGFRGCKQRRYLLHTRCTAEVTGAGEGATAVHKIWVRELGTVTVLSADSQCRCRSFLSDPRGPLSPRPAGYHVERGKKQIGQQTALVALEHE